MKIWILASVASFVLFGGDVWGAEDEKPATSKTAEDGESEKPKSTAKAKGATKEERGGSSLEALKEKFMKQLDDQTIPDTQNQQLKTTLQGIIGNAVKEGYDEGIKNYCPKLREAKDNDFIKILLDYAQKSAEKRKKRLLKNSKTMDYKGKKEEISAVSELIDTPGVKYFSGLRRRYNGVFRLLPQTTLLSWEGLKINLEAINLQLKIDTRETQYWSPYTPDMNDPSTQKHIDKIYLYDTFNITGIDLSQFIAKIDFTSKEKRPTNGEKQKIDTAITWKDLPLRKKQTKMMICDMHMKTDCYKLEGWKKNIKGCSFHKINICLRQAQEFKSEWLTKMLEDYFDYSMSRINESGRVLRQQKLEDEIPFSEFYSLTFSRFAPKNNNQEFITDRSDPAYILAKNNFTKNENIRKNAVYALVLNEASKRHIDQTGKLEDKAFLKEQLTLLLQDAGEIIAQIQYKRQEVNSGLGNLIGSGDMDSMSHQVLKEIIKTKVKGLHDEDNAKAKDTASGENKTKTPTKKSEGEEQP